MKPDNGQVFSPQFLAALRDLTEAAWQVPYSTRVDSITNFQHSFAEGDDLTVQDLVGRDLELNPAEIENIRKVALSEPLLVDKVISADAQTTSVNVTVTLPQKAETESAEVMAFAREMAEKYIGGYYQTVLDHYQFHGDHLRDTKGYEYYGGMSDNIARHGKQSTIDFFMDLQIWGTPEQCYNRIVENADRLGSDAFTGVFSYAGMPWDMVEANMKLFAKEVMPELQKLAPVSERAKIAS